jgi:phosphoribosylaminoimidazole-succinocarboxamide synthase
MSGHPLLTTALPGLSEPRRGKVREVYDLGDQILIISTDRLSAFDVVMANGVPDKGRILNQMSAFWFRHLAALGPHHVISTEDVEIARAAGISDADYAALGLNGRCTLARKAQPVLVECVARGYITGSLYKQYRQEGGSILGLDLPAGLLDGDELPVPIFTPATKAQSGHDENISYAEAAATIGEELAARLREWTLALYNVARQHAATRGLILADTKFEFGLTSAGELIWIDEALSPDSSRFWEADQWKPGGPQPGFDKQFVRDWLEQSGWNKQPPGPELPETIITQTRDKYVQAFERVVGKTFVTA